ncbi:hypothetical protein PVAND_007311 [Polypedilum vanderplanki]|uniref:Uncharacterized protein n=1 Tax=Polypedilum vanderplanki TaxID=319348 RepID=A0A9J6C632_POLVA|nr:hypothetical protein PVAND_007311 [Polypedilum vanderplanki]
MFKTISIFLMAIFVVFAAPEAKPNPEPKAKPDVIAYTAPVVAPAYVPSAAIVERSYHGNGFVYPYASAPYVAAYSAYTAPILVR